ncbi:MAG: methylaspartate ammonia-lyase [Frankiales bacterium]|nr:methylaspartate ammonia-lyase [Frankiales bacterium]
MRIVDVVCVPARAGFFTDDAAAIAAGAKHDGFRYAGPPLTPGFTQIRQPGEALSVLLLLEDGQVAHGDCAAVQYSGVGGRDPVFTAALAGNAVLEAVAPALIGAEVDDFAALSARLDDLRYGGRPLHTAVRYGVSQALLDAAARARGITMAEVVRDDWDTGVELGPVPMFVQSGDDRYANVDKMILKQAGALPHGLVNNVETKLGLQGEILAEYVTWVRDRVLALRAGSDYVPTLHFDVYGTVGAAFGGDTELIADYLARLGELAAPFALTIEQAVDAGSTPDQVKAMSSLREALSSRGSNVSLAVDEWCNTLADIEQFVAARAVDVVHVKTPDLGGLHATIEALLLVRRSGLRAYCGGTCNETDRSAQVCAHVAMACGAAQVLAKPGMGVDEGLMVVGNEMARVTALAASRSARPDATPAVDGRRRSS